jgi:hypothetical protein
MDRNNLKIGQKVYRQESIGESRIYGRVAALSCHFDKLVEVDITHHTTADGKTHLITSTGTCYFDPSFLHEVSVFDRNRDLI